MTTKNAVALVSGASSGIGNACATYLGKRGLHVYGTSRRPESYKKKADEFFDLISMDQTDETSVIAAVQGVVAEAGSLDLLVCNAGMGIAGSIEDTPIEDAATQMNVNFLGACRTIKAALPIMRAQGKGTIIVTGSMAGRSGIPFQAYYSASKFALEGLVEALRMEVAPFGIRVAIMEPGDFQTGFTSSRRVVPEGLEGPYKSFRNQAISVMAKDEMNGTQPIEAAKLVYRLFKTRRLRVRYTVGPAFQRLAMGLKRILPSKLYEAIFARLYGLK